MRPAPTRTLWADLISRRLHARSGRHDGPPEDSSPKINPVAIQETDLSSGAQGHWLTNPHRGGRQYPIPCRIRSEDGEGDLSWARHHAVPASRFRPSGRSTAPSATAGLLTDSRVRENLPCGVRPRKSPAGRPDRGLRALLRLAWAADRTPFSTPPGRVDAPLPLCATLGAPATADSSSTGTRRGLLSVGTTRTALLQPPPRLQVTDGSTPRRRDPTGPSRVEPRHRRRSLLEHGGTASTTSPRGRAEDFSWSRPPTRRGPRSWRDLCRPPAPPLGHRRFAPPRPLRAGRGCATRGGPASGSSTPSSSLGGVDLVGGATRFDSGSCLRLHLDGHADSVYYYDLRTTGRTSRPHGPVLGYDPTLRDRAGVGSCRRRRPVPRSPPCPQDRSRTDGYRAPSVRLVRASRPGILVVGD